ncbi:M15 family metallopeptidase [Buttiauxella massiliensis]|uniref:M15 family metallopeptidase n=1 Tax=Buttiauxella massiliensis TaxID=2831590 RepID=UPI00125EE5AA|nr:M15 family metallopeptidase [Buttiauxella massiliensis]
MNINELIRQIQTELNIDIDGKPGPQTWTTIYQYILKNKVKPSLSANIKLDEVDARSEENIELLLPEVKNYARALVHKANEVGITIKVISGLRTYAEQDALYAQGRTKSGEIVTNAKGGYSNHNFAIAFDIGVFEGNKYLAESAKYKAVGAMGIDLGLEWGGSWKTIIDQPHFQLRPVWAIDMNSSQMLAELRKRHAIGKAIF